MVVSPLSPLEIFARLLTCPVSLRRYWTAATGEVTELDPNAMDVEAEATSGNEDEEGGEE